MAIRYLVGDATQPQGLGPFVIAHIVNDQGAFGAGFSGALSAQWPQPEAVYRQAFGGERRTRSRNDNRIGLELGDVQFVRVAHDTEVANMCAQTLGWNDGPPIRYAALRKCLATVASHCRENGASLHGPRFGSGLSGGDWNLVAEAIRDTCDGIAVHIYDLGTTGNRRPTEGRGQ